MSNKAKVKFSDDWQQVVSGRLVAGKPLTVVYDSRRLPEVRDTYNGEPTWSILNYIQFYPTRSGASETPLQTPGVSDDLSATFYIPSDAKEVVMWFKNTGRSGRVAYDSQYGDNYHFRFPQQDINLKNATVVTSWPTPYSGLSIEVSADPDVERVQIRLHGEHEHGDLIDLMKGSIEKTRQLFECHGMCIPYREKITFEIIYWVGGRSYLDDNGGKSFEAEQQGD